ncbi:MAG: FAD-dependent oxidoreductase [Candidatus Gracilibacteria bacterium]|nr:FAD-dependent oxidoreductase [Candidatus Gracilibacteria bacterium]
MYDLIILGIGPAGLSAALYAGRFQMNTLVIGEIPGGLMVNTDIIENYPGFLKISGVELTLKMQEQVQNLGIEIKMEEITKVEKIEQGFRVSTAKEKFESKMIVFATGGKHRHLGISREKEFEGKGISACANCDAPLFKDKPVAVVGGSDTAARYALLASEYSSKVYVFYRGTELRAEPTLVNALKITPNIEIIYQVNIIELKGTDKLEEVLLDNGKPYKIDALFLGIGQEPQSQLAQEIGVQVNKYGGIIIDKTSKTNVKGVYAAGDVTASPWKQIIIGNAEGAFAAFSAYEDLKCIDNETPC